MSHDVADVGLVVVNYGSAGLLSENLATLQAPGRYLRARIFVVDNFSTETNRREVVDLCSQMCWTPLLQAENLGFGRAVNIGFDVALAQGCSVLLALNPDARISPDVLDALAEEARAEPASLISPRIVDTAGAVYFSGSQLDLGAGRLARRGAGGRGPVVDWITGACLVVHADAWRSLGGFDHDYFLYWEDVDLSYRATRTGLSLTVRADLAAVHDEGGTHGSGGRAKSDLYYRYNCRNRLLFAAKHLSARNRLRWMLLTPRESLAIYLRGGRRQLLTSPSGAVAALHGSCEGLWICSASIVRTISGALLARRTPTVRSVR